MSNRGSFLNLKIKKKTVTDRSSSAPDNAHDRLSGVGAVTHKNGATRRGPIGLQQGFLTVHRGPAEEYWAVMRENGIEFHHRKPLSSSSSRPVMRIDMGDLTSIVETTTDSKKSSLTLEGQEGTKKTMLASKNKEDIEAWILTIRAAEFLASRKAGDHWLPKTIKAIIYSFLIFQEEEFNAMGDEIDPDRFDQLVKLGHCANEMSISCFRLCLKLTNTHTRSKFKEKSDILSSELIIYAEKQNNEESKRYSKDLALDINNTFKNLEKDGLNAEAASTDFADADPYLPSRKSMNVSLDINKSERPQRPSRDIRPTGVKMQTTRERGLKGSFFRETSLPVDEDSPPNSSEYTPSSPSNSPVASSSTPNPTWRSSSPKSFPPKSPGFSPQNFNAPNSPQNFSSSPLAGRRSSPQNTNFFTPRASANTLNLSASMGRVNLSMSANFDSSSERRSPNTTPKNSKSLEDVGNAISKGNWQSTSMKDLGSPLLLRKEERKIGSLAIPGMEHNNKNSPEYMHDELMKASKAMFISFGNLIDVINPSQRKSKDDRVVDRSIKESAKQFLEITEIVNKVKKVTNLPGGALLTTKMNKIREEFHVLLSNVKQLLSNTYEEKVVDDILAVSREGIPIQIREVCQYVQFFLEYIVAEEVLKIGLNNVKNLTLELKNLFHRFDSEYQSMNDEKKKQNLSLKPSLPKEMMGIVSTSLLGLVESLSSLTAKAKDNKEGMLIETKEIGHRVVALVDAFNVNFNDEMQEDRMEVYSCVEAIKNMSLQLLKSVKEVAFSNNSIEMMQQMMSNCTRFVDLCESLLNSLLRQVATEYESLVLFQNLQDRSKNQEFWVNESDEGNIISERDEQGQEVIKAATLNKLIERLTAKEVPGGTKFLNALLTTYRSFTTPAEFFQLLVLRYNVKQSSKLPKDVSQADYFNSMIRPIHLRVFNVLKIWFETSRFDIDKNLGERILEFLEKVQTDHQGQYASTAKNLLASFYGKSRSNTIQQNKAVRVLPTIKMVGVTDTNTIILEFDEEKIAHTLTMMDSLLFCSIKPSELLGLPWMKSATKHKSVNVLQLSQRFNQISNWVVLSILSQDKLEKRTQMYEKFVLLGVILRRLNNYSSLFALTAALYSSAIHRLKFTIEGVDPKIKKMVPPLQDITSPLNNFRNYREIVKVTSEPMIPYLGVWQSDLLFIEEGNSNFDKDHPHLINFKKRYLCAEVIQSLMMKQQARHNFDASPKLITLFNQLPLHNDENKQYTLSLLREPRNAEKADVT
eukprot:TRINITY_DN5039_c0_g1_i1.p1 TRINITY_DN5039_c0_g1~~TRINITY_DN5039_c0_g1_i1.p1  ORF type:complete len:1261 (-),score=383.60 TRINITY_DN5039_c0_g1_i1:181-3963(-)